MSKSRRREHWIEGFKVVATTELGNFMAYEIVHLHAKGQLGACSGSFSK